MARTDRPDFLVIGAPKSGSTSLHHYLRQHPQLFLPPRKEPSFLAFGGRRPEWRGPGGRWALGHYVFEEAAYRALFADAPRGRLKGEVSVRYLSTPEAADHIHAMNPAVRLIAVLRHPVDRAWSAFLFHRRDGWEPCRDLLAAFRDDERRRREGWQFCTHYWVGLYGRHLARYRVRFPASQFRIHLFEDFAHSPGAVLEDLFRFLEVPPAPVDTSRRHNPGGRIRNPMIRRAWAVSVRFRSALPGDFLRPSRDALYRWVMRDQERPRLDPELRQELTRWYRDDLLRLQDLLQRDLGPWLDGGPPTEADAAPS